MGSFHNQWWIYWGCGGAPPVILLHFENLRPPKIMKKRGDCSITVAEDRF